MFRCWKMFMKRRFSVQSKLLLMFRLERLHSSPLCVISDVEYNQLSHFYFRFAIRKIMLLEFRWVIWKAFYSITCVFAHERKNWFFFVNSQYLENYLWVNYTPKRSSNAFLMSISCIVNEKFRENVPAWEVRRQLSISVHIISQLCVHVLHLPRTLF